MRAQIHHAALNVDPLDWYVSFFETVFGMEVRKTAGKAPHRKVWFHQGIQLNECAAGSGQAGPCDHVSIAVEDVEDTVKAALAQGCTPLPNGANWFVLPNGFPLELMELA